MSAIEILKMNIMKLKIEEKKEKAQKTGKFSLYHTHYFENLTKKLDSYNKLQDLCDMINSWEDMCNISYEFGMALDKLINNSDYVVAIHRTNLDLNKEKSGLVLSDGLNSIMNEGLVNYGHSNAVGGGAFSNTIPSISLTMTPMSGFSGYINFISNYKNNDAVILSAFPKAKYDVDNNLISGFVDEELSIVDETYVSEIYDISGSNPKIKPEYIIGAVLKKTNGLDEFYSREEIINSVQVKKK